MSDAAPWLDALVNPRRIAVVGASGDPTRVAGRAVAFLRRYGFAGEVWPVHPTAAAVQGRRAYARVEDLPCAPELAIVSVRSDAVRSTLQSCAARGVQTAIVYASGFAEQDRAGAALQDELREVVDETGMRVLGPNCLGAVSLHHRVTATFASVLDDGVLEPGPVALLTQSGAFASFVYGLGRRSGVRFGFFANTGNEMDLTLSELLEGVVELPTINSVLMHVEGLRDVERFALAAERARALAKPLAVVKVGTSAVGAMAARAHTNSDVGDDSIYERLFRDLGILRLHSMEELADAGQAFQAPIQATGNRATIVSISGGTGVLMADVATAEGLQVPELSPDVRARLAAVLPAFASTRNPVDVTGGIFDDLARFQTVLTDCMDDPGSDVLLVALGNASASETILTDAVLTAAARGPKPMYVAWVGGSGVGARRLAAAGIPTFTDPNRAVRAAALSVQSCRQLDPH
jgi:acyl-CoA synthetase (NDP forming)